MGLTRYIGGENGEINSTTLGKKTKTWVGIIGQEESKTSGQKELVLFARFLSPITRLNGSMFQPLTREAFSELTSYSWSPDEVSVLRATIIQENSSVNNAHMKSAHKFRREENF